MEDVGSTYTWSPPTYMISHSPSVLTTIQVSKDPTFPENFARTVKWSPDGSTLLAHCENRTLQLLDQQNLLASNVQVEADSTFRIIQQPSPILDFIWYPSATCTNPATFCFVASVRECPVKLLDASDGRLRASYKIVDHRERQIAPHSLAFNLTADKLYCGFEDAVEVFDVHRPGEGLRLPTTPSKKTKEGLKGIISALSFSPSYGSDFYAAGSLSPTSSNIAMFSEAHGETPIMFVSGGPRAAVAQLHFNPARPHILYAAFRRHSSIYSWDVRSNVDQPVKIFSSKNHALGKNVLTNQKTRFDVDSAGRWLAIGDQEGSVSMFDLGSTEDEPVGMDPYEDTPEAGPTITYKAHDDTIGSVAFHPLHPILASGSGSRHFDDNLSQPSSSSSSSDESDEEVDDVLGPPVKVRKGILRCRQRPYPVSWDSSVKLWHFA